MADEIKETVKVYLQFDGTNLEMCLALIATASDFNDVKTAHPQGKWAELWYAPNEADSLIPLECTDYVVIKANGEWDVLTATTFNYRLKEGSLVLPKYNKLVGHESDESDSC